MAQRRLPFAVSSKPSPLKKQRDFEEQNFQCALVIASDPAQFPPGSLGFELAQKAIDRRIGEVEVATRQRLIA